MSSDAGLKYAFGRMVATNAIMDNRAVGFVPARLRITNLGNQVQIETNGALESANFLKRVAAGDLTVVTSGGPTMLAADGTGNMGFRIPVLADVNDAGVEDLLWEAWGGGASPQMP